MKIVVKLIFNGPEYCIGKMYLNGEYFCDTLEDTDRGLMTCMSKDEILKRKIYGQTRIPRGTYKVDMNTISPKFKDRAWAIPYKGKIPRLIDVPGYEGVLIHVGNKAEDTLGCILVGENKFKGRLVNSTYHFNRLMNELLKTKENITITID